MPRIVFDKVSKLYPNGTPAVIDLALTIPDGEFLCVLGPSGCGKSSTVRMLAGLEEVTDGEILSDGRRLNEVPPQQRDAAMVFENYALYPHLSARENIAMPLRARQMDAKLLRERVDEVAATLRIVPLLERKPNQLSGGERQRVAIGRAIVREPQLFLMDEPLGHLEAYLRVELRAEIRALQERLGITTVYVTHDQEEAAAIADRIAVMAAGRLQQTGGFLEVLDRPRNLFVAGFVGEPPMNFVAARLDGDRRIVVGSQAIDGPSWLAAAPSLPRDAKVTLGVRPSDIEIVDAARAVLVGDVTLTEPQGSHAIVRVATGLGDIAMLSSQPVAIGERIGLGLARERLHLFDAAGETLRRD